MAFKKKITRSKKVLAAKGLGATSALALATILETTNNKAFAECWANSNGWGCTEIEEIECLPENSTIPIDVTMQSGYIPGEADGIDNYPIYLLIAEANDPLGLSVSPEESYYNGFSGGLAPTDDFGDGSITQTVNITTPNVNNASYINAYIGLLSYYKVSEDDFPPYEDGRVELDFQRTFRIENFNEPFYLSDEYETTIDGDDVTAEITVEDDQSNGLQIIFEISSDFDFNTILQSETYDITGSESVYEISHTFTNLDPGTYYWRAQISETGVTAVCSGTQFEATNRAASETSYRQTAVVPEQTAPVVTSITGTLFLDNNRNGTRDEGELGVPNVTLRFICNGDEIELVTQETPPGEFNSEIEPCELELEVDETDLDIPEGYYYNGPTNFSLIEGQINDLGDLPMIIDPVTQNEEGSSNTAGEVLGEETGPGTTVAQVTTRRGDVLGASTLSDTGVDPFTILVFCAVISVSSLAVLAKQVLKIA